MSSSHFTSSLLDDPLDFTIKVIRSESTAAVPAEPSTRRINNFSWNARQAVALAGDLHIFVDKHNDHTTSASHLLKLTAKYLAPKLSTVVEHV